MRTIGKHDNEYIIKQKKILDDYEDYMMRSQAMTDGEEIRAFFDELNEERNDGNEKH